MTEAEEIQMEPEKQSYPVLLSGQTICESLKRLSGTFKQNYYDEDNLIEEIVITDTPAPSGVETAEISSSGTPVTAWFDSQSKTIYISTKKDKLILNNDSSYMFCNMEALKKVDLSRFDTSSVTNMWGMFLTCESLTKLDLSKF